MDIWTLLLLILCFSWAYPRLVDEALAHPPRRCFRIAARALAVLSSIAVPVWLMVAVVERDASAIMGAVVCLLGAHVFWIASRRPLPSVDAA